MPAFLNFLKYNNAIPIAISIVLLGSASAFAATDPGAIYSSSQQVLSVDNSYLVNKNLSTYTPRIEITSVTEDSDNYYVNYALSTIDLQNYVWQDVTRNDTMTVSKADLGPYRDLGVYVEGKMADIVNRELDRLQETQADARNNQSSEVVATKYGGLVGKFLSPSTETLPGYTPVVVPPAPPPAPPSQTASANQGTSNTTPPPTSTPPPASNTQSSSGNTSTSASSTNGTSLVIQILGNNPAQVPLGSSYVDLGAVVTQPANSNLGIHVFVNGTEVQNVAIDTSQVAQWSILYKVTDQSGNITTATRVVNVFDPNATSMQSASSTPPTDQSSASSTPDQSNTGSNSSGTSSSGTSTAPTSPPASDQNSGTSTSSSTPSDTGSTDNSSTQPATSTPPASGDTGTGTSSTTDSGSSSIDASSTTQ